MVIAAIGIWIVNASVAVVENSGNRTRRGTPVGAFPATNTIATILALLRPVENGECFAILSLWSFPGPVSIAYEPQWTWSGDRPGLDETVARLREEMPAYEDAGVTLALETYEQISTAELVKLVETVGSTHPGVCLHRANTVARLELPAEVTKRVLPHIVSWHVKDFDFTRSDGWVSFTLGGALLGTGKLDYTAILHALPERDRDGKPINHIIERWLPWQGDCAATAEAEAAWTKHNLNYMKEKMQ